jgi:hypothetical protein
MPTPITLTIRVSKDLTRLITVFPAHIAWIDSRETGSVVAIPGNPPFPVLESREEILALLEKTS